MYFAIEKEKVLGMSPVRENLSGNIIESPEPGGWDGDLEKVKWDGKSVVWKSKEELAELEAKREKAEKLEEFKRKTHLTPEAFSVIAKMNKFLQGEILTTADKLEIAKFVKKYEDLYKEVADATST